MKYVKQGEVVKEVADHLAGDYVSAGWKTASKDEFERVAKTAAAKAPVEPRGGPTVMAE